MSKVKEVKEKLKKYKETDIIITNHAHNQAIIRNVDINDIKENIINPERLVYVKEQESNEVNESKYDCYFSYSKTQCQRYILVLNKKCIVCTVIKIKRRWQYIFEKK